MAERENGGNGWRAATSRDVGKLEGELRAVQQLLSDPEFGLSALNRKITETRHETAKMRATQFALGGLLVAAGAIIGGAAPQVSARLMELAGLIQGAFG